MTRFLRGTSSATVLLYTLFGSGSVYAQQMNNCADKLNNAVSQSSDINVLSRELSKKRLFELKKGEFEKTADFEEFLKNKIVNEISKKSILSDGSIIFFIKIDPEKIRFNADKEKMEGFMIIPLPSQNGSKTGLTLMINSKEVLAKKYTANNSFGAKVEVSKVVYDNVVVEYLPDVKSSQAYGADNNLLNFTRNGINMNADTFRKVDRKVIFAFSGKFYPPYLSTRVERAAPTMTSPIEMEKNLKILHVNIECGAFFSQTTNAVLSNFVEP